jgi:hypothetical protein
MVVEVIDDDGPATLVELSEGRFERFLRGVAGLIAGVLLVPVSPHAPDPGGQRRVRQ